MQKNADEGQNRAAYLFGLVLKEKDKDSSKNYFKKAGSAEPLAHLRLAETAETFSDLVEHANALWQNFAILEGEGEHAAQLVQERLRTFLDKGEERALLPLLNWYALTDEPVLAVKDALPKKNLSARLLDIPKSLFEYLKKCAKKDADLACQLGDAAWREGEAQALNERMVQARERACVFWRIAQKKKHLLASWMIITRDPLFELHEQRAALFHAAVALAQNTAKETLTKYAQVVIKAGIARMTSAAAKREDFLELGLLSSRELQG